MGAHHGSTPKRYKKETTLNVFTLIVDLGLTKKKNMSLNLFDVPDVDYRYEASRDVAFQPALTGKKFSRLPIYGEEIQVVMFMAISRMKEQRCQPLLVHLRACYFMRSTTT